MLRSVQVGFSRLQNLMTIARTIKLYSLPKASLRLYLLNFSPPNACSLSVCSVRAQQAPQLKGLRPMEEKDLPAAHKLLEGYLRNFKLAQEFDEVLLSDSILRERVC